MLIYNLKHILLDLHVENFSWIRIVDRIALISSTKPMY